MKPQSNSTYGINRLESKTARAAIIQKIVSDFNLMPIIAEAYYKQISFYTSRCLNQDCDAIPIRLKGDSDG